MSPPILIVDDKPESLYFLRVLLEGHGYRVVEAANGLEALNAARQAPPLLILADILMPVMDGFALCREWKRDERLRTIPFIFYTATYTDERDREFALNLGAERFIVKPADPEDLLASVREVLEQNGATSFPSHAPSTPPSDDDRDLLVQYNATLVRKLEYKIDQVEKVNRALEREVAEHRCADAALSASETKYRMLFRTLQDAVVIAASDHRILEANPSACALFGRSEDELARLACSDLFAPSDEQLPNAFDALVRDGFFRGELRFIHADGTTFPGEVSSVFFMGQNTERLTGIVIRDLTTARRAEDAIRSQLDELKRWYKALLDRESRVLDLKREVNTLLAKAGQPPRYESIEAPSP